MYNGYSFTKHYISQERNARYKCANATNRSCKAHVYVNYAGTIIKALNEHNHEPNKYIRTSCGKYVKTKSIAITQNRFVQQTILYQFSQLVSMRFFKIFINAVLSSNKQLCVSATNRACIAYMHMYNQNNACEFSPYKLQFRWLISEFLSVYP